MDVPSSTAQPARHTAAPHLVPHPDLPDIRLESADTEDLRAFAGLARTLLVQCAEPFGEMLAPDHPGELARRALRHICFALDRLYIVVPFPRDTTQLELAIDNLELLTAGGNTAIRADPRCVALIKATVDVVISHVGLNGTRASAARRLLTAYLEILDAVNASADLCAPHFDAAAAQITEVIQLLSRSADRA